MCLIRISCKFASLLNAKEWNLIGTSVLLFVSLYGMLIAIFGRSSIDPFEPGDPPHSHNLTSTTQIIRDGVDSPTSVVSLFLLWVMALVLGRVVSYVSIPPLLGMLITGLIARNTSIFYEAFRIDTNWSYVITKLAVILILIRCGVNIRADVLRRALTSILSLGFLSTTAEAAAIFGISYFVFGVPLLVAILFAYVLCSTSPAVTVPSMIYLQHKRLGIVDGIPTIVLAAASIDNVYCITAFSVVASFAAAKTDNLVFIVAAVPLQIIIGAVVGVVFGFVLRHFPHRQMNSVHFVRCTLMCALSAALFFGSRSVGFEAMGPVAVLIMCVVSATEWKTETHHHGPIPVEKCFRVMWNLVFQPFLFLLIGLLLDFSQLSFRLLWIALAIIGIGVLVRFCCILLLSICMPFNVKKKLFVAVCFFPKATIQAALAPLIIDFLTGNDETSQIVLQTSILSILITAPLGQLIIDMLGVALLKDKNFYVVNHEKDAAEKKTHIEEGRTPHEVTSISSSSPGKRTDSRLQQSYPMQPFSPAASDVTAEIVDDHPVDIHTKNPIENGDL